MVNKYALLASLLRLSEEPTEYFNEIEINECLLENTNLFMDLLENFYIEWCTNSDLVLMPIKQLFSTEGIKGDFRVMPCVINEFNGHIIKAVKIIGTNEEEKVIKDKISVGKSLLLHPTDNFPIAIFDVCALSSFRTAAISILAYKYFIELTKSNISSNKEKVKIGIIGAGRIAFYTAIILHQWLGINEVEVFEINKKHTSSFLSSTSLCCDKLKVTCKSIDQLNSNHNAVFLCTNSGTPILSSLNAKNIAFISSVGADADNLSELHSSILEGREIYTDSKQSMFIGDLQKWSQLQLVDRKKIYELTDMIKKSLNKNHKKFDITKNKLFISTGVAIQDALISHFLYSRLQKKIPEHNIVATSSKNVSTAFINIER